MVLTLVAGVLAGCGGGPPNTPAPASTLVLYDTTGQYGALGELYGMQVANLASHFGTWAAHPVSRYTAGELTNYSAVVYVGSTYDEPLPAEFLDDVAGGKRPVLWLNANIWQLSARHPEVPARLGFTSAGFDIAAVTEVRYKGVSLSRDRANNAGIMRLDITDPTRAQPVAHAVRADGVSSPWGVRSGNFTYVGEVPFTYISPDDRYLAFTDLLFDTLAPATVERHRALVRIEDVGPHSDPAQLRAITDYLSARQVPFSVAVIAEYHDPAGRYSGGAPVHRTLSQTPAVADALRYMSAHGGTLLMHGYTHQYGTTPNPFGVSAEDFEFYRAHIDPTNSVVLDGPVPEDSSAWAAARLAAARAEWAAAGLPAPKIFEFPHYTASATDYRTVSSDPQIEGRYERATYFSGVLTGDAVDHSLYASQFFPYPVRDVYGAAVIPETLGNVETQGAYQHEARLPADILATARRQLVVRDGVASFFYHPFLGLQYLPSLVENIRAMGYTFVPADTMIQPAS